MFICLHACSFTYGLCKINTKTWSWNIVRYTSWLSSHLLMNISCFFGSIHVGKHWQIAGQESEDGLQGMKKLKWVLLKLNGATTSTLVDIMKKMMMRIGSIFWIHSLQILLILNCFKKDHQLILISSIYVSVEIFRIFSSFALYIYIYIFDAIL